MAESLILNKDGERETLGSGVQLLRHGNLRTLVIQTATYGTVAGITLSEKDRPPFTITGFVLKHYNGSYGALAVIYIYASGQIGGATYWSAYHNGNAGTSIVSTDHIIGEVTWSVV